MNFLIDAGDDTAVTLDEALAFIDSYELSQSSDSSSGTNALNAAIPALKTKDIKQRGVCHCDEPFKPASADPTVVALMRKSNPTQKSCGKPPKKRRARSVNSSSTALQRRKRAELEALRSQVVALQDMLVEFEYAHSRCSVRTPASTVETTESNCTIDSETNESEKDEKRRTGQLHWYNHAVQQYRERLKAEVTNRRLKAFVENHVKINNSLCELLQEGSVVNVSTYNTEVIQRLN